MSTAPGATFGLGPTVLGVPVLPEAGLAVVARAGVRTEAASSATATDRLPVHAPNAGVATAIRVAHGVAIGVGASLTPRVRILVLATVVPAVATALDVQEGVPTFVALLPTRVAPATRGAAGTATASRPIARATLQAPTEATEAVMATLPA